MRVLSEVPSQLLIIRAACVLPIILTARDQISDRIEGLNAGADYLVKPFDLVELSARIHAVARRYGHSPEPSLKFVAERNGRIRLSAHSHRLDTKLAGQPFN